MNAADRERRPNFLRVFSEPVNMVFNSFGDLVRLSDRYSKSPVNRLSFAILLTPPVAARSPAMKKL
jgi:hypothetical protein